MKKQIKITFTEEVLGTASNNPEIHSEFIAANGPDAKTRQEEIAAIGIDESVEKAMTVFSRNDGGPILWDYQIKGFFKDACGMLTRCTGTESAKLKAYKKIIDGLIFVGPRKIALVIPKGAAIGNCQRPLRGQTAQGERIALANSETVPVGTTIMIELIIMNDAHEKAVIEWLNYGSLRGIGQWRNSGKGKFTWEEIK